MGLSNWTIDQIISSYPYLQDHFKVVRRFYLASVKQEQKYIVKQEMEDIVEKIKESVTLSHFVSTVNLTIRFTTWMLLQHPLNVA
jgi:hypothetical protein